MAKGKKKPAKKESKAYQHFMTLKPIAEIKFLDTEYGNVAVGTAGSLIENPSAESSLIRIAQGDGPHDRDGRQVKVIGLLVRGYANSPIASSAAPIRANILRLCYFIDKQCNGLPPTTLSNNDTGVVVDPSIVDNILAPKCPYQTKRYEFIKDKIYHLPQVMAFASNTNLFHVAGNITFFKFYQKCDATIEYDNQTTTGALNTIRSNNITGFVMSAGAGNVNVQIFHRIYYIDM